MKLALLAWLSLAAMLATAQQATTPADAASTAIDQTASQTPENKPKRPKRVRISQMAAEKLLIYKVQPEYPIEARKKSIEGIVVMKGVIALDGTVKELRLVSGDLLLAESAHAAVIQWRYKPYMLPDGPVEAETTITVNYTLKP